MKKLFAAMILGLLPLAGCAPYGYPHGPYAYYDWDWNRGYDGYGPRHYYAPAAGYAVQPGADTYVPPSTNWWFCGYYYYPYPPYAGYYPYYGYQQPGAAAPTYTSPAPAAPMQPAAPAAPPVHVAPLPPAASPAYPVAPAAPSNYAPPPAPAAASGPPAALARPPDYYSTYYGCCSR
ncbi:MAG TPA: hypothetical protein VIG39_11505 [Rhizomicrobium sp.]|jgi:hypothetical protein